MQEKMRELIERYYQDCTKQDSMLSRDLQNLQHDFAEEFKRYAPDEIINADFSTYTAYTHGLASGGIRLKLEDPLERYKTREWLSKSFFEWFPKYRFLESYRLDEYQSLDQELSLINDWRARLIELIDLKDKQEKRR
ncbi:YxiJ family protein [Saccharibacillus sacchari]|uniref:YxiJ family protein n=1 Tax=Saccharibacillus sacchari TaxID=456493 RepID=UPI001471910B|nr:YxiJ family protein [Saccharibacillus sacchari]